MSQPAIVPEPSDFRRVLQDLVRSVPGAWGAIFVDWEGEAVDLFATTDEYEVKLAGAHTGLLLNRLVTTAKESGHGRIIATMIRAERECYFLHMLDQEYFVLLATHPGPHAGIARARLADSVERLRKLI
jgi:predicted regulator of Ras-like GTPase activity (Roadblock/LC7/MglB family)